ncbi:MAG: hypothetical protein ACK5LY_07855 [Lachnospirales bacterium]
MKFSLTFLILIAIEIVLSTYTFWLFYRDLYDDIELCKFEDVRKARKAKLKLNALCILGIICTIFIMFITKSVFLCILIGIFFLIMRSDLVITEIITGIENKVVDENVVKSFTINKLNCICDYTKKEVTYVYYDEIEYLLEEISEEEIVYLNGDKKIYIRVNRYTNYNDIKQKLYIKGNIIL